MPCGEFPSPADVIYMRAAMQLVISYGTAIQGTLGEQIGTQIAVDELGWTPAIYDAPLGPGIDRVFQDQKGTYVFVECKTSGRGPSSLDHPRYGRQASHTWNAYHVNKMHTGGTNSTHNNQELADTILGRGIENTRSVLFDTDPSSGIVTGYELQADGSWDEFGHWELED